MRAMQNLGASVRSGVTAVAVVVVRCFSEDRPHPGAGTYSTGKFRENLQHAVWRRLRADLLFHRLDVSHGT